MVKSKARTARVPLGPWILLNHCVTRAGCRLLRHWLRNPCANLDDIRTRFTAVALLRENIHTCTQLRQILSRFNKRPKMMSTAGSLLVIATRASALIDILRICPPELRQFVPVVDRDHLSNLSNLIRHYLDDQGKVRPDRDHRLDQLRQIYASFPELLDSAAHRERNFIVEGSTSIRVAFLPQLGFVIELSTSDSDESLTVPNDYNLLFNDGSRSFYKNQRMHWLDQMLGDVEERILERERLIVEEISKSSALRDEEIENLGCPEIDVLACFAHVARIHNFVKPEIHPDNHVTLIGSWNPMLGDKSVSNDLFEMKSFHPSVLIASAATGKSNFCRHITLICFLAHVGSFVPASRALLPLLSKMVVIAPGLDPVSSGQSAFSEELRALLPACAPLCSGDSVMVIVDDFGRGTCESDSIALMEACIHKWAQPVDGSSLFVLVATAHWSMAVSDPRCMVHKFVMLLNTNTYQVRRGYADNNLLESLKLAKQAAFPANILARASMIVNSILPGGAALSRMGPGNVSDCVADIYRILQQ